MHKLSSQFIRDIIKEEMVLDDNQIWLRNQNKVIPDDDGLYIIVGIVNSQPFSNITEFVPVTVNSVDLLQENQRVTIKEDIQIDVVSADIQAAQRAWEVIAAINSLYSKQIQDANSFKIFKQPTHFVDLSGIEGGSTVNRYSILLSAWSWYVKSKVLPQTGDNYYDDFTTRVDDNKTIDTDTPVIEFEINSSGVH